MCYYRMKIRLKESQAHARRTGTFHSIVTIGVPWLFLKYDSINTKGTNKMKPCLRSCHLLAHLQVVLAMCYYRMKIRLKESQAHARRTGTFHSIVTIGVPWLFLKYDSINTKGTNKMKPCLRSCHLLAHLQVVLAMCYYRMKIRLKESQAHARRTGTFHSIVTIGVPWLFLKYDSINTKGTNKMKPCLRSCHLLAHLQVVLAMCYYRMKIRLKESQAHARRTGTFHSIVTIGVPWLFLKYDSINTKGTNKMKPCLRSCHLLAHLQVVLAMCYYRMKIRLKESQAHARRTGTFHSIVTIGVPWLFLKYDSINTKGTNKMKPCLRSCHLLAHLQVVLAMCYYRMKIRLKESQAHARRTGTFHSIVTIGVPWLFLKYDSINTKGTNKMKPCLRSCHLLAHLQVVLAMCYYRMKIRLKESQAHARRTGTFHSIVTIGVPWLFLKYDSINTKGTNKMKPCLRSCHLLAHLQVVLAMCYYRMKIRLKESQAHARRTGTFHSIVTIGVPWLFLKYDSINTKGTNKMKPCLRSCHLLAHLQVVLAMCYYRMKIRLKESQAHARRTGTFHSIVTIGVPWLFLKYDSINTKGTNKMKPCLRSCHLLAHLQVVLAMCYYRMKIRLKESQAHARRTGTFHSIVTIGVPWLFLKYDSINTKGTNKMKPCLRSCHLLAHLQVVLAMCYYRMKIRLKESQAHARRTGTFHSIVTIGVPWLFLKYDSINTKGTNKMKPCLRSCHLLAHLQVVLAMCYYRMKIRLKESQAHARRTGTFHSIVTIGVPWLFLKYDSINTKGTNKMKPCLRSCHLLAHLQVVLAMCYYRMKIRLKESQAHARRTGTFHSIVTIGVPWLFLKYDSINTKGTNKMKPCLRSCHLLAHLQVVLAMCYYRMKIRLKESQAHARRTGTFHSIVTIGVPWLFLKYDSINTKGTNKMKPCLRSCHLLAHLQVVLAMCYYRMKIRLKESQAHARRTGTFHSIVTIGVPWLFLKYDSINTKGTNKMKPCLRSCHLLAHLQVVLAMCYYRMKIRLKESQAHARRTGTFHSIVIIGVPWL